MSQTCSQRDYSRGATTRYFFSSSERAIVKQKARTTPERGQLARPFFYCHRYSFSRTHSAASFEQQYALKAPAHHLIIRVSGPSCVCKYLNAGKYDVSAYIIQLKTFWNTCFCFGSTCTDTCSALLVGVASCCVRCSIASVFSMSVFFSSSASATHSFSRISRASSDGTSNLVWSARSAHRVIS